MEATWSCSFIGCDCFCCVSPVAAATTLPITASTTCYYDDIYTIVYNIFNQ